MAVFRFRALFSPAAITQTVRLILCLEEIIAIVAHARVPVLGISLPGFTGELIEVV